MNSLKLKLTQPQAEFLLSDKKFTLFKAGVGSGKSFIGSHYVYKKISQDPNSIGLIAANTYKQLNNATLTTLFLTLDEFGIPFEYNQNKGILDVCGRKIYCYSLDNYEPIRGIQIGWFWLDECAYAKEEAFKVILGRLRHPGAKQLEGRLTSTPAGFNWLYEWFVGDRKTEEYKVIEGTSYDNIFLPPDYLETLKLSYDAKAFEQEVLGRWVNINTGSIYYAFSRENNVTDIKYDPALPIKIGCDFNINPITAVVAQVYNETIHVFDEIYITGSNTHELADEIIKRYGTGHTIVPDDTGKRKQTSSSGWSDHAILRSKGLNVASARNPFRIDRYNTMNNLLEKKRLLVDASCKKTIKDLEQVTYKEGSSLPDTSNSELTHVSDGLGYLAWSCFPILKNTASVQSITR